METLIDKVGSEVLPGQRDTLADEEPLEIRLGGRSLSITMRTPGQDGELAAGFLLTEGILRGREEILFLENCAPNVVRVELATEPDLGRLQRDFYTSSSCGVCGKASLDAVAVGGEPFGERGPRISASLLKTLPDRLRESQALFDATGGIHAAGLFDASGNLLVLREDVGRHNAVDKVIGHELLAGRVPRTDALLLVSGRASFELMQKALMGGIPFLAAVGAPSSLALQFARRFDMTLVGFLRRDRFNLYHGKERVIL